MEIHHNILSGNPNGILGAQTARGSGPDGPYVLRNLFVHDNTITMTSGGTGVLRASNISDAIFRTANNRFEGNVYHLGSGTKYFRWLDSDLDEAGWRAAGHDLTGTFNRP